MEAPSCPLPRDASELRPELTAASLVGPAHHPPGRGWLHGEGVAALTLDHPEVQARPPGETPLPAPGAPGSAPTTNAEPAG